MGKGHNSQQSTGLPRRGLRQIVRLRTLHRDPKTAPLCHFFWTSLVSGDQFIFSPLQSEMISAQIWNKIYHLTLTALPHYRVKYEQVQFYKNCLFFTYFLVTRMMSLWCELFLTTLNLLNLFLRDDIRLMPFKCVWAGQCTCTSHSWNCQTAHACT